MCGRYRLTRADKVASYFEAEAAEELHPRYNIAPSQQVAAIRQVEDVRVISALRWGLVPFWAKDVAIGYKMINSRSESVLEKPAFRDCFHNRRCLIPADGFYEWKKAGKLKQPFHFGMKDGSLFALAGIWDRWKSPPGTWIESCSILTTTPNAMVRDVHDRMPVILHRNHYETWLNAPASEAGRLGELLIPFEAELMTCYEVSSLVNRPQNDVAGCAEPWSANRHCSPDQAYLN